MTAYGEVCCHYDEGYDDGYNDAEKEVGGGTRVCGGCGHWYPSREACYYYPVAKRLDSCGSWCDGRYEPPWVVKPIW